MDRDVLNDLISFLDTAFVEMMSGLSQLWLWLSQAFLVPGDYILGLLVTRAPWLVDSIGLNAEDHGVVYAAVLSAATWLFAAVLVKAGYNVIRNFVESMFYGVRNLAVQVSHRLRMIRLKLVAPIRRIQQRFNATKSVYFEEFDVDDLQLAILRAQSKRAPGHVITAVDIAEELGVRPLRAQQALDSLKKLHLVEVSFGTTDGFSGYFLTRPGEIFLSTCGHGAVPGR
jgi:hypothetical protein